jgi:outer membrane protein assembly factor BamB
MSASTGEVLWTATVEGAITFQPAVAHGMVYVSTNNGGLFAFETGDVNDHGWLMWGANAQHNGGLD